MKSVTSTLVGLLTLVSLAFPATDSLLCRLVGHCDVPGPCVGVAVSGHIACVALAESTMCVLDVSDTVNPVVVGRYVHAMSYVSAVDMDDDYAYLADNYGLRVIDVRDPANPTQVGVYHSPCALIGVTKVGKYAYVCAWTSGLRIVDVSNPVLPVEVGHCDTDSARTVVIDGNYAYLADQGEMRVIDISDPANPFNVGRWPSHYYAEGVDVFSHYAIVADGTTQRIIDVSDPTNPNQVGCFDQWGYAYCVEVVGEYAYVAEHGGLRVIDIADPTNPLEVGHYYDTTSVHISWWVEKVGKYLYTVDYLHGLQVVEFYGEEVGVEEGRRPPACSSQLTAALVRGVLFLPDDRRPKTGDRAALLDAAGRRVMELQPGPNDVQHLGPGVYFISSPGSVEKVILTR